MTVATTPAAAAAAAAMTSATAPGSLRLSKSKIAAFQQCPRKLWLQVHRPWLAEFDERTREIFACGHKVGELARLRYPSGTLVAEDHRTIDEAVVRTRKLLDAPLHEPIFEAAFVHHDVVVRADVLEPDGWGGWRLIEVKNAARVRDYQLHDLATQAWVLKGNSICLSALVLTHVERVMRPTTLVSTPVRFVDVDVSREVLSLIGGRPRIVQAARAVTSGPEPAVRPGFHCQRPPCQFRHHCHAHSDGCSVAREIRS